MDEKPPFRPYLFSTLFMIIGGWGGLALLLNYTRPSLWPRWGFFALIVIALSGLAIPISFFLNRQFSPNFEPRVIARQAIWVGFYGAILAWLQISRALNFTIGLWLAIAFIVIEYLVRWRETASQAAENPEE
jgi:hypothetical protein